MTLDLGGNRVYNSYTETARVINYSKSGTSKPTSEAEAGTLTIENGTLENTTEGSLFQVYAYNHLIFGKGCVAICHSPKYTNSLSFGVCVMQLASKVTFANGCVVKNTVATPFASAEEVAETAMYDSWYPLVGQNEGETVITYEEGSYTESSGPAFKTNSGATSGTVIVNGGTIVSQYKNLFPTGNTNFSLTINGGHIYNAVLCPVSGNNVTGGTVGKNALIINWIGEGCSLKITGEPKFYTLNEQTVGQTFNAGTDVLAADSLAFADLTVYAMGKDSAQAPHLEGAQCRTVVDSLGLRFQSSFDKELVDMVNNVAVDGSVKIGTLIAPYSYVQQVGELTLEAFNNNGLNCLNVPAVNGKYVDTNGDTVVKAAIVNIKDANKSLDFVATAYIEWVDLAGITHTCYSNSTPTDADARNILEVASLALEDFRTSREGDYANEVVINGETVYARINQAQVDALLKIVG